ncbi:MAG: GspH/FimT family pseudopilin [Burkholderiaceae bacterium]|nr:GspH/FimT family pseudopilin [Burkholderiaceae bacterium]
MAALAIVGILLSVAVNHYQAYLVKARLTQAHAQWLLDMGNAKAQALSLNQPVYMVAQAPCEAARMRTSSTHWQCGWQQQLDGSATSLGVAIASHAATPGVRIVSNNGRGFLRVDSDGRVSPIQSILFCDDNADDDSALSIKVFIAISGRVRSETYRDATRCETHR